MREFYDPEDMMDAIQEAIDRSVEQGPMRCIICKTPTLERCVGIPPEKPARPFLFAVCEGCQAKPGWQEKAAVLSAIAHDAAMEEYGHMFEGDDDERSEFGSTEGYDSTDYSDLF